MAGSSNSAEAQAAAQRLKDRQPGPLGQALHDLFHRPLTPQEQAEGEQMRLEALAKRDRLVAQQAPVKSQVVAPLSPDSQP